jgi:hypothetical protein
MLFFSVRYFTETHPFHVMSCIYRYSSRLAENIVVGVCSLHILYSPPLAK